MPNGTSRCAADERSVEKDACGELRTKGLRICDMNENTGRFGDGLLVILSESWRGTIIPMLYLFERCSRYARGRGRLCQAAKCDQGAEQGAVR
jgi:hypothetical protein